MDELEAAEDCTVEVDADEMIEFVAVVCGTTLELDAVDTSGNAKELEKTGSEEVALSVATPDVTIDDDTVVLAINVKARELDPDLEAVSTAALVLVLDEVALAAEDAEVADDTELDVVADTTVDDVEETAWTVEDFDSDSEEDSRVVELDVVAVAFSKADVISIAVGIALGNAFEDDKPRNGGIPEELEKLEEDTAVVCTPLEDSDTDVVVGDKLEDGGDGTADDDDDKVGMTEVVSKANDTELETELLNALDVVFLNSSRFHLGVISIVAGDGLGIILTVLLASAGLPLRPRRPGVD